MVMADLPELLPSFPTSHFADILHALDVHEIRVSDLLASDFAELSREARVSLRELRHLHAAILHALHEDLLTNKHVLADFLAPDVLEPDVLEPDVLEPDAPDPGEEMPREVTRCGPQGDDGREAMEHVQDESIEHGVEYTVAERTHHHSPVVSAADPSVASTIDTSEDPSSLSVETWPPPIESNTEQSMKMPIDPSTDPSPGQSTDPSPDQQIHDRPHSLSDPPFGPCDSSHQTDQPRDAVGSIGHASVELPLRPAKPLTWATISTLDPLLDRRLAGGIPAGYVTEITGESGAGKTQFLLSLLLAVQLPPPHGLGRPALYISTETPLSTRRLAQILNNNPMIAKLCQPKARASASTSTATSTSNLSTSTSTSLPSSTSHTDTSASFSTPPSATKLLKRPSLDNVISTVTPDLESQEHILQFQVPVEVERRKIGLVILDSVAANYRAEFDRKSSSLHVGPDGQAANGASMTKTATTNLAQRTQDLLRLGAQLRRLAQRYNLAVVVANQVADRFLAMPEPDRERPPSMDRDRHDVEEGEEARPEASQEEGSIEADEPDARDSLDTRPPRDVHPQSHEAATSVDILDLPTFSLDYQQRWFSGWGDDALGHDGLGTANLKTPSLGLVWTNQLAMRLVLLRRVQLHPPRPPPPPPPSLHGHDLNSSWADGPSGSLSGDGRAPQSTWQRWFKVVFAPHVEGSDAEGAVEVAVQPGGLQSV